MSELPTTLTYFGNLQTISQVLNKSALPLYEANELCDPFLPDKNTLMAFSKEDLFENSVKHIAHAILGRSAPRGQPNHPLQKAIGRWRMENRFSDEVEIKEALQGLLPAMVEKTFNEASESHQSWVDYVSSKRLVPLFEKFQELELWETKGCNHKGAAIKFKCPDNSIFEHCEAVHYQKYPASIVNQKSYVEHMIGVIPKIDLNLQDLLLTQNYAHRKLKEWRLLIDNNKHIEPWIEFPVNLIQSIYIGALVNDKTAEQFKNHLLKLDPAINVFRARCKANEFNLEMEKISDNTVEAGGEVVVE